jgi:hypothetical protein
VIEIERVDAAGLKGNVKIQLGRKYHDPFITCLAIAASARPNRTNIGSPVIARAG